MSDYQQMLEQAVLLKNNEQYQQAIQLFDKLSVMAPNEDKIYFYRANIYNHSLKEYMQALADYNKAIELKNDDEYYYYNRALCHLNLGDQESALEDYNRALAINADYALALWDRALINAANEDFEDALVDLKRVLELSPYSAAIVYKDLGNIYYQMEELEEALKCFDQSLALDEYSIYAYKGRGNLYMALGEYEKSLADFTKAAELDPTDKDNIRKKIMLYQKMNREDLVQIEKNKLN